MCLNGSHQLVAAQRSLPDLPPSAMPEMADMPLGFTPRDGAFMAPTIL